MDIAFLIAVTLSALVTITLRALPIALLSKFQLPSSISDWLGIIPSAMMSAIVVGELLAHPAMTEGGWSISALAALCCIAIGALTQNLFLTVLSGMLTFAAFQWLIA